MSEGAVEQAQALDVLAAHPKLRSAVVHAWQELASIEDPVERAAVTAFLSDVYAWEKIEDHLRMLERGRQLLLAEQQAASV